MNVKIDTKDKFSEICPEAANLSANMSAEVKEMLLSYLDKPVPHVIFNATNVSQIAEEVLMALVSVKEEFITADASLVFCCLQPEVNNLVTNLELADFLNVTPTLSEAWDMVQMEEIERELLKDAGENLE